MGTDSRSGSDPIGQEGRRGDPLLRLVGVSKSYPGVRALDGIDLDIWAGECHAMLGQNGAGKSTLVKIMSGIEAPSEGELYLEGARVRFSRPIDAQQAGIYTIHQELSLAPALTVAENVYISDLPRNKLGVINWNAVRRNAAAAVRNLGFDIPVDTPVGMLSMAEQQVVEIAKAVHHKARVLLLDEPTATLPQPDVDRLFEVVDKLRSEGVAVVFISHRLDEVYRLCDRISVMRDGRRIQTRSVSELAPDAAVRSMVGESLVDDLLGQITSGTRRRINPKAVSRDAPAIVDVRGLSDSNLLRDISLTVKVGEAVAVTGLVGSGQSELGAALFGSRARTAGEIQVNTTHRLRGRAPREAIGAGLGMIPEDRKSQGLVLDMTVKANISLASLGSINRFGIRQGGKESDIADEMIRELGIKVRDAEQVVGTLSGGNQQKVVFAKWIAAGADVLIINEPTRGVDVSAKESIYDGIARYLAEGGSVLLLTSELSEALMADRIYVMQNGRLTDSFEHEMTDLDHLLGLLR